VAGSASGDVPETSLSGSAPTLIDLTDTSQSASMPVFRSNLILTDFVVGTSAEMHVSALLIAYRGAALISGLIAVVACMPTWRAALGVGTPAAAWTAFAAGLISCALVTCGQVHATLSRASFGPGTAGDDDPADHVDLNDPRRANELQLRAYQELALTQARSSYRQSQSAMATALGILLLGGMSLIFWVDTHGQIVVGVLTGLGSGFSAFLGKTFLNERNRSVGQLNRSYALPLAKNLLLFSQSLAKEVKSDDTHDDLLKHVVESALTAVELTMPGSLEADRAQRRTTRSARIRRVAAQGSDQIGRGSDDG